MNGDQLVKHLDHHAHLLAVCAGRGRAELLAKMTRSCVATDDGGFLCPPCDEYWAIVHVSTPRELLFKHLHVGVSDVGEIVRLHFAIVMPGQLIRIATAIETPPPEPIRFFGHRIKTDEWWVAE